jgi:hypothetical protein
MDLLWVGDDVGMLAELIAVKGDEAAARDRADRGLGASEANADHRKGA